MSTTTQTGPVKSKVEQNIEVNLDEIFNAAPSGDSMIQDNTKQQKNIFSGLQEKADMSFADPDDNGATDILAKSEEKEDESDTADSVEDKVESKKDIPADSVEDIFEDLTGEDTDEEADTKETRGRKSISGISDVFSKLIKEDKIVAFDDDKALEDYSAKDWEELIQANLDEKANEVRRETPKQFFNSLPQELQIAARYVADGGKDLKGLFTTLGQVEETKSIDTKSVSGQERVITEYLSATGYGTAEDIQEEEIWKDLGKLETQANKFKPKLDKMQEKVVAQKLEEQDLKKKQQENASQEYMKNVYETLKEGKLGDLKVDRKTQAMLYNGLVQPNYPSVSGRNTNLLGHLLEKYQFVEPNYSLISEALWLLQDPTGYKAKIMDKGAQKSVEKTVRKLKSEQSNVGGASLGVNQAEKETTKKSSTRKIQRPTNIFKRI